MTTEKGLSRRTFLKEGAKALGLLGAVVAAGTYPFVAERFWYQVKEVRLTIPRLPSSFKGWKMVQFSDVHFGFHYGVEDFRHVINIINDQNPDIIILTGDLIETGFPYPEQALPLLKELKARRGGKWAVMGNHDFFPVNSVPSLLRDSDFIFLQNGRGHIEVNQERLYIAGLDDALNGVPDMERTFAGLSEEDCVMLLVHEPDVADWVSKYPVVCAQFSGHSHGGQVRLPWFGPVISQNYAKLFVDGLYHVGNRQMPLYVNRGIGTTQMPVRLYCRPEITLFHLS